MVKKGLLGGFNVRKYFCNEDYFKNINTERKAYWLGLIAADGCVHKQKGKDKCSSLTMNLHEQDKEILEKFTEDIESTYPLQHVVVNKGKRFESPLVKFNIHSMNLCEDLVKLGIVPRKTYSLEMPNIPEYLESHFIRGFFDGDGHLNYYIRTNKDNGKQRYTYSFEIVGQSLPIIESLQEIFAKNGIKTNIYTRKSNQSRRLMTSSKSEVLKIIDYLYKDSTIHLERKHKIIQQVLEVSRL